MKWVIRMPEIKGKTRWEVAPCVVNPQSKLEKASMAIAIAAIQKAKLIGTPISIRYSLEALYERLRNTGEMSIDYWEGKKVYLFLKIIKHRQIHISLDVWASKWDDDVRFGASKVTPEAVNELEKTLELAQSLMDKIELGVGNFSVEVNE